MDLGHVITFLGPFFLSAMVFVFLTVVSSMLFFTRKEEKLTMLFVFLIMLALFGYTVFDSLLSFLGIDIQSASRIEENKHLIILCSRLEILFLTLAIVAFSGFVSYLVKGKVAFVKFLLVALVGLGIGGLSLFSDKFFYSGRLKLNINKYMGQEGELFIIFIAFFALVIAFDLFFLAFSFKKVKENTGFTSEGLRSVFIGIFAVIFFGVLEALELFGVTRIYPYFPSLLGVGTVLLGFMLLRFVLYEFYEKVKELKLLDSLVDQSAQGNKKLLEDLVSRYSEFGSNLTSLREMFEETFKLPEVSLEYAGDFMEKMRQFLEYYYSKVPEFEKFFKFFREAIVEEKARSIVKGIDIGELSVEVERGFQKFGELGEKVGDMKSYSLAIAKDFSLFVESVDKFDTVFLEIFDIAKLLDELIEKLRIVSINTEIISSKRSFKESSFLKAISSEIFEKVSDSRILLKTVLKGLDKLKSIGASIRDDIAKGREVILSSTDKLKPYEFKFEPPKEIISIISDTYSKLLSVEEYTSAFKNFISDLENFVSVSVKEFSEGLKSNFALAKDIFFLEKHFSEDVKSLNESILLMVDIFKRMERFLQKFGSS